MSVFACVCSSFSHFEAVAVSASALAADVGYTHCCPEPLREVSCEVPLVACLHDASALLTFPGSCGASSRNLGGMTILRTTGEFAQSGCNAGSSVHKDLAKSQYH
eukprot:3907621-Amphidinium_carterae.1